MKDVVVIGAGKIGSTVAGVLASTGDYQVTLADRSPDVLARLDRHDRIRIVAADVEDSSKLVDLLNGQFAVLNAAPFHLTTIIAEAARAARTHYLDLTEDVASMRRVRELAADASIAFIPQCGLAPGFVSIVAFDMAKRFEVLDHVKLRVGATRNFRSMALPTRRSIPRVCSGPFATPSKERSAISITARSAIRAMRRLCARF